MTPSGPGALWAGFAALDPDQFQYCFLTWVQQTVVQTQGTVIACDGKTVRRSDDRGAGKSAVHMVSAWASANRLVLGQRAVDKKSNDTAQRAPAALPALLNLLMVKGCIVTIDAMGCQTAIAQTIIDREADDVLALKENQETMYHEVVHLFADAHATGFADDDHDAAETVKRRARASGNPAVLDHQRFGDARASRPGRGMDGFAWHRHG